MVSHPTSSCCIWSRPRSSACRRPWTLDRAGFTGLLWNPTEYGPSLAPVTKGWYTLNQNATPEAAPTNATMASIIQQFNSNGVPTDQIGRIALQGYFMADMFIKILDKVGPNLTQQAFQQAAANFTYEIPNTVGPTTYPEALQVPTSCVELVQSNGTIYQIAGSYACYDVVNLSTGKLVPYASASLIG
jgi:hypothetical protein